MSRNSHTTYWIDFVKDCGADPTGVVDCAAAFNTARNLINALGTNTALPKHNVVLYFPKGIYILQTAPIAWDGTGLVSSLMLKGSGQDGSILQLNGVGGGFGAINGFDATNFQYIDVQDLTIIGTVVNTVGNWDCAFALRLGSAWGTRFHRVRVCGVFARDEVILLANGQHAAFVDSEVSGCSASTNAAVYAVNIVSFDWIRSHCFDLPVVNGVAVAVTQKTQANVGWVFIDTTAIPQSQVLIDDAFFDEGCNFTFKFTAAAATPAALFKMKGVMTDAPAHPAPPGGFILSNILLLDVEGFYPEKAGVGILNFVLTAVQRSKFSGVGKFTDSIQADATSGPISLDSVQAGALPGNNVVAPIVTWEVAGVLCDLLTSGAAIVANRLVKLSAAGTVIELVAGDAGNVALVRGVSLDAAAGAGAFVRVARPSQIATMLADGTAAMALNARVVPSAVAGRIVPSGVATGPQLGIVAIANAGALDTVTTVWYVPGNMGVA